MTPGRVNPLRLGALLTFVALAWCATSALAAPKTDRIVMRNRDRITCEIQSLDRGRLVVKTDDIGTLDIEWNKVDTLRANATFEIEDLIGQHFYGRLREGPRGGTLSVETAAGIRNLDMLSVVRISRLGESIWNRLDGAIDLGTSYTSASDLFTLDFAAETTYKRPKDAFGIDVNVTLTTQPEVEDTRRWNASLDFIRRPPSRWLISGQALLEQNRELGFDLRSSGSASAGRYFVQTAHDDLLMAVGASVNKEQPVEGETTNNAEYLLTVQYDRFSYDFPKVDIFIGITAFRNMSGSGRTRLEAEIGLRRELFKDFNLSIRGYESYDSQPASEDAELNDYGLTFGFGWSY
jgi:hypothetical protein